MKYLVQIDGGIEFCIPDPIFLREGSTEEKLKGITNNRDEAAIFPDKPTAEKFAQLLRDQLIGEDYTVETLIGPFETSRISEIVSVREVAV